ncbi:hypothetical protein XNC3_1960019 [Xenorhabdus nematophila F1]|nr:hypothetical protein XNC3_1960019 [Xenorhabdus nematophila F1]
MRKSIKYEEKNNFEGLSWIAIDCFLDIGVGKGGGYLPCACVCWRVWRYLWSGFFGFSTVVIFSGVGRNFIYHPQISQPDKSPLLQRTTDVF